MVQSLVPEIDYEGNATSLYYVEDIDTTYNTTTTPPSAAPDLGGVTSGDDAIIFIDPTRTSSVSGSDGGFDTDVLWISGLCLLGFVALTCCCISIVIVLSTSKKKRCVVPMPVQGMNDIEHRGAFGTTREDENVITTTTSNTNHAFTQGGQQVSAGGTTRQTPSSAR